MQNGKKTFHRLTSLLLAALLALAPALAGMVSVASAAVDPTDPKWGGVQPLITEDNYVTRDPDPEAPAAWGAVPDDAQLYYQEQELSAFIHFGVNTFTGAEWGTGTEDPKVFDPTGMKTQEQADEVAEEWVKAFQDGGFKRVILVAKHHDGFCLWPSAYTVRDVASSSVPDIDVVLAVSRACTKLDMDMGIYLSPWDESDPSYGYYDADHKEITPQEEAELIENGTLSRFMDYNYYYDMQLRELLDSEANGNKYGNNGKFVEVWMDGAKGSGANAQEYDMDLWFTTIHELQPDVRVFYNMASAGIHWVGNEKGTSGDETCWTKFDITSNGELTPTKGSHGETARAQGLANGQVWTITECDVSIRNGWFHGNQHSMDELVQMYYNTVGHGAVWLLNVPPDSTASNTTGKTSTGRFSAEDIAALKELGDAIKETYATNFASAGMGATATTTIGTERTSATAGKFSANNVLNGDKDSYWTIQDGATTGQITIDLGAKRTFDLISLQEYIPLGQRIASTTIEYFDDSANTWKTFGKTTTVGARRLVLSYPVTSSKVRVTVTNTTYCTGVPLLRSVGVYKAASIMSMQGLFPSDFTYIDDRAFTYTGTWTQETGAEGLEDTFTGTGSIGVTVTGKFTGTKFYVIGIKGPRCGQVEVAIDGDPAGVFEAHAEERTAQQVLYTSPDLSPGEHTITLKVKEAAYSNGNQNYFNFDGIYYVNNENGILDFSRDTQSVKAGEEVTVTITRTGSSKGRISFDVIDQPDSAVSGQHYEYLGNLHITMEDGETETTVTTRTKNANESVGAKYYLKIIDVTGGAVAGAQASTCIQIADPTKELLPDPQAPATITVQTKMAGVTISGAAFAGQELKAVLDPEGADATYEWVRREARDGTWATLEGETGPTYMITADDVGANIFVWATGTDGSFGRVRSGGTALIQGSDSYVRVTGVTLAPTTASLTVGGTAALTAAVAPEDASIKTVEWASSDESVVTVSESGEIKALKAGSAEITVTTTDGSFTATCAVTVASEPAPTVAVTGVTLTPTTASLTVGETTTLTATVAPETATDKTVSWTSSDESVAEVSASGVVTALKEGSAEITVTTTDGSFTATCTVTVTSASAPVPVPPKPETPEVEVKENEDGSTTTTVTDPASGVVTETTEKSDGTVEVVETKPDGTVTETVTDLEGGTTETVTAPNKDVTITVTDPEGEVLVKTAFPAAIPETETRFVDVPEDHWADEAIHDIAALGIIEGVGNDQYGMTTPMTRGMLATVLFRMSNGSAGYELDFKDVDSDKWYADGIAWAAKTNVVNGFGNGMFAPDAPITREQFASMLYRYAALLKLDSKASADALNEFADGADTHSWAVEGMAWCVENGILRGKGNNVIDPRANATRAEAAVMLRRFIDLMR